MSDSAPNEHLQDGVGEPDALDRLWTPHRMAYIKGESKPSDGTADACPFCRVPSLSDEDGLIVHRGEDCFVVLNLYPYTAGHLMICPYRHVADRVLDGVRAVRTADHRWRRRQPADPSAVGSRTSVCGDSHR